MLTLHGEGDSLFCTAMQGQAQAGHSSGSSGRGRKDACSPDPGDPYASRTAVEKPLSRSGFVAFPSCTWCLGTSVRTGHDANFLLCWVSQETTHRSTALSSNLTWDRCFLHLPMGAAGLVSQPGKWAAGRARMPRMPQECQHLLAARLLCALPHILRRAHTVPHIPYISAC